MNFAVRLQSVQAENFADTTSPTSRFQMTIFREQQENANLFEITDSDVEESQIPSSILSDDEENDDVDIE